MIGSRYITMNLTKSNNTLFWTYVDTDNWPMEILDAITKSLDGLGYCTRLIPIEGTHLNILIFGIEQSDQWKKYKDNLVELAKANEDIYKDFSQFSFNV